MDVEVILDNKVQFTRRLPNNNDIREIARFLKYQSIEEE